MIALSSAGNGCDELLADVVSTTKTSVLSRPSHRRMPDLTTTPRQSVLLEWNHFARKSTERVPWRKRFEPVMLCLRIRQRAPLERSQRLCGDLNRNDTVIGPRD